MGWSTTVKVVAPFAALGVTWAANKALSKGYAKSTGNDAPRASDPDTPLRDALAFALASAAIVAVTNVLVDRLIGNLERHEAIASGEFPAPADI